MRHHVKGSDVRRLRKRLGLTQRQLADLVGVAENSVARWERDEMRIRESAVRLMRMLTPASSTTGPKRKEP